MRSVAEEVRKVYQYAEPNLTLVGWMGMLGYPVYYYVWTYLFPQPYENLILRIVCSILFSIIAFREKLPKSFKKYMPQYYLLSIGICLPFFFSFMMFMNDWSNIWTMSFMASIFLHILTVYETRIMLMQAAVSVLFAFGCVYGADLSLAVNGIVLSYIPIFLFTYIFGTLFYFRNQVEHESKVSIAKSFGAGIAHEMRNPLGAVQGAIDVVKSLLPHENIQKSEYYSISHNDLTVVKETLSDAENTISIGNETIDLLLTSIDESRVTRKSFKKHSLSKVIEDSLECIPFLGKNYRDFISLNCYCNAYFLGSDTLIKYVIFNLIKNSFSHQGVRELEIEIKISCFKDYHELIYFDNGSGIPEEVLGSIFKDFFTYGKKSGSGLGLPFCRRVMHSLGGTISCKSKINEWTQFTLKFPSYFSCVSRKYMIDIIVDMSILYIGRESYLNDIFSHTPLAKRLNLIYLDIQHFINKKNYEFEYEVIFLDLDELLLRGVDINFIEKKLCFTEAKIIYIHEGEIDREVSFFSVEKNKLEKDFEILICDLIFEDRKVKPNNNDNNIEENKKTILIADDNQSIRTYSSLILEQHGFKVIEVNNGQEVVEELKSKAVDLVIMDIEMPKMNGLEATYEIRLFSSVPIVAYTGNSSQKMIDTILQSGMNDYIVKPANTKAIIDKISFWI